MSTVWSAVRGRMLFLLLALLGCGSRASEAPETRPLNEASPANESAPSCEGRHEVTLTFLFYGEEGRNETVSIVCEADHPRAVVDASSADLSWSRWEQAWVEIEALDSPCRSGCPPEPDTDVEFRDADGKTHSACTCASRELVDSMLRTAVDAGLHPVHTR